MIRTKSFTLIEIIIVLTIIAALIGVLILVLNPQNTLNASNDLKRQSDLKNLNLAISLVLAKGFGVGSPNIVYTSLPDSSSTCSTWINQGLLSNLPSGWVYHCSASTTYQNIDGTGWLPINFRGDGLNSFNILPIDPTNNPPYYYTYVASSSQYELTALFQDSNNIGPNSISGKDGGDDFIAYEVGSNLSLTPAAAEERNYGNGLVAYWPFDEGQGSTTTDASGNGNNGSLINLPQWVQGIAGMALSFNGSSNYINAPIGLYYKKSKSKCQK